METTSGVSITVCTYPIITEPKSMVSLADSTKQYPGKAVWQAEKAGVGQKYNKSAHRKALLKQLNGRSDGAVELKHQNISAVLRDLDCFWIPGYKPRGNYQAAQASC